MNVFVTGATGYVGEAIVQALVRAGHDVTGVSRSAEKDARLTRLGATPVRGALGRLGELVGTMARHDALVHAAHDYALGPPADREAIDAMLRAARSARRPISVVYTSGVWVLGPSPSPASEAEPIVHPAAAVAWRPPHERVVLEAATGDVATAVVRPGIVFGERRGLVAPIIASAAERGAAEFVGPGDQRWAFIHRTDLAELYRSVVERRARGIFHGVDGESPAISEVASALSRAAAGRGAIRAIPPDEARRQMGPVADALAMDQVIVSTRGVEVDWTPRHAPIVRSAEAVVAEWRG